jgi:hypothetical protein
MNYSDFLEDFESYNEWNNIQKKKQEDRPEITPATYPSFKTNARSRNDLPITRLQGKHERDDRWLKFGVADLSKDDRVNSPSHYTSGKTEVIDIIEDAVKDAPSAIYGLLQGQVLKYMLRVWLKDNPVEDMKKARWYLDRLIEHYENPPGDN